MSPLLPQDHLELEFRLPPAVLDDVAPGEEDRRIVVRPRGEDWLRRMAALRAELHPWADAEDTS